MELLHPWWVLTDNGTDRVALAADEAERLRDALLTLDWGVWAGADADAARTEARALAHSAGACADTLTRAAQFLADQAEEASLLAQAVGR